MTPKEADKLIKAVATWLETYKEPEAAENYPCEGEDKSAELARSWCKLLLEASSANGLSGCRYCQS